MNRSHTEFINGFSCAPNSFFWVMNRIFFQYSSLLILMVCSAVMIAVSLLTEAPAHAKISGLTYGTTTQEDRAETRASYNWRDIASSALVLVLIVAAYR